MGRSAPLQLRPYVPDRKHTGFALQKQIIYVRLALDGVPHARHTKTRNVELTKRVNKFKEAQAHLRATGKGLNKKAQGRIIRDANPYLISSLSMATIAENAYLVRYPNRLYSEQQKSRVALER